MRSIATMWLGVAEGETMFHKLACSCAAVVMLSVLSGGAKAACSVPNPLTNGTTADAFAVMGNFTSLAGCAAPLASPSFTGNVSVGGGHIYGQASGGYLLWLGTGTTDSVVLDGGVNAFYPNVDNAWSNGYSTRRWTTVFATNGTIQTSDARLKRDIANLKAADGLPAVLKLRPVTFHWKEPSADPTIHYGFVAQEVQTILPNVVDIGNDSRHTLGMNYSSIIPSIVKAVQELNQKVERNRNAERRDVSIASMKLRLSNQQLQLSELGKKYEAELLELGSLRGELKRLQRKVEMQTAQN